MVKHKKKIACLLLSLGICNLNTTHAPILDGSRMDHDKSSTSKAGVIPSPYTEIAQNLIDTLQGTKVLGNPEVYYDRARDFLLALSGKIKDVIYTIELPTQPTIADKYLVLRWEVDNSIRIEMKDGKPVLYTFEAYIGKLTIRPCDGEVCVGFVPTMVPFENPHVPRTFQIHGHQKRYAKTPDEQARIDHSKRTWTAAISSLERLVAEALKLPSDEYPVAEKEPVDISTEKPDIPIPSPDNTESSYTQIMEDILTALEATTEEYEIFKDGLTYKSAFKKCDEDFENRVGRIYLMLQNTKDTPVYI